MVMIMNDNLLVSPLLSSASSSLEVLEKTIISEQVCKGLPTVLWMWIPLPFYEVLDPSVPFSLLHNPFWLVNVFSLRQVSRTFDARSSSWWRSLVLVWQRQSASATVTPVLTHGIGLGHASSVRHDSSHRLARRKRSDRHYFHNRRRLSWQDPHISIQFSNA